MDALMRRNRVRIFFVAGMMLCQGCAQVTTAFLPNTLDARIQSSQSAWKDVTTAAAPENIGGKKVGTSQDLQAMLSRMIEISPLKGSQINVYVLDDNTVNAFTEGKSIYVNSGLLSMVGNNQNQVATVIGHELGHIIANHVRSATVRNTATAVLPLLMEKANVSALTQTVTGELLQIGGAAYSRGDETEADAIGTVLAFETGYDPLALIDFFDVLEPQKGSGLSKFVAEAVQHLISSQKAQADYAAALKEFQEKGLAEIEARANQSAKTARQEQAAFGEVLSNYKNYVSLASPWYRSHPPSDERKETIRLVVKRERGEISAAEMEKTSSKAWKAYETFKAAMPKK